MLGRFQTEIGTNKLGLQTGQFASFMSTPTTLQMNTSRKEMGVGGKLQFVWRFAR
jgi:hypothetical protein